MRRRQIAVALQVAVDPVAPNLEAAPVTERLQVAVDYVPVRDLCAVGAPNLQVAVNRGGIDPGRAAALQLDVAADEGMSAAERCHRHGRMAISLNVAVDPHSQSGQLRSGADPDVAVNTGALKAARCSIRHDDADLFGTRDEAARFAAVAVAAPILDRATQLLAQHDLRTFDSVQLASGIAVREVDDECGTFACFDRQLRRAAAAQGFQLIPAV